MKKVLIAGLTLIVAGFLLAGLTDLNPAIVFIGGFGCTVVALSHLVGGSATGGAWGDAAGDVAGYGLGGCGVSSGGDCGGGGGDGG